MKSLTLGKNTSRVEVQDIFKFGVWLFAKGREYFLPYKDYPWFEEASVSDVYEVKLQHGSHLYWPNLDVDLELKSLEEPQKYPLKYK